MPVSLGIIALQVFGSYRLIEKVFKWLALALVAYIAAALFAKPDIIEVVAGSLIPTIHLDPAYIGILAALLGTTISPYLFFWQASQEVEEQISIGRRHLRDREGASRSELRYALLDTMAGMVFAEVVAYSIILATGATLFVAGKTDIASATDAAQALRPLAGDASALLLAVGVVVGTVAAGGHRAAMREREGRSEIDAIHRVAEAVASGAPKRSVVETARRELIGVLHLAGCDFDERTAPSSLPRLERTGTFHGATFTYVQGGFVLPSGIDLEVASGGAMRGRFVLHGRPDKPVSIAARLAAVVIADQVGAALAADGSSREERT